MCGLAGIIDPHQRITDAPAVLAAMRDCIAHRGPDDAGLWWDPATRVGLAHRRLSIIDLSPEGHQPMVSASGRYRIVFNGEVYNFDRLRPALEDAGVRFRGHSDTEVMLAAFERHGIEAATKAFEGMFAFAVWDAQERSLTLARDRIGKKPLYWGTVGEGRSTAIVFASELKALRRVPGFRDEIDRDALVAYLRFLYVPGPMSIFTAARKLGPGTLATISHAALAGSPDARSTVVERPYWSAREVVRDGLGRQFAGSPEEAVDELERLLRDATALRMISDVPLGAFLSGGIDSSTIVALMQSIAMSPSAGQPRRPVRTFTIGFNEKEYDEAKHAAAIAKHLGTDHTELTVTAQDALDVVPKLPAIWDEPFADASQIPTYLVSKLARAHVTVALSGDGGDELFGGYNRYVWADRIWRGVGWMPRGGRRALAGLGRTLRPAAWDRVGRGVATIAGRHRVPPSVGLKVHKLADLVSSGDAGELYARLVSAHADPASLVIGGREPSSVLTADDDLIAGLTPTARMMYLDLVSYLVDDILVKVDRASMAASLEARAPLLDHRVVEFAWRLPMSIRMRDGVGKWPLRQLLERHVPRELFERPKMGFGVPVPQWLRGPLREWAEDLLSDSSLRRDGLLEPAPVRTLWAEFNAGQAARWSVLWGALMYLAWRRSP